MRCNILSSKLLLTVSAVALAMPMAAAAQVASGNQAGAPDEAGATATTAPSQIVVTARRTPTPADQIGQSFTVMTAPQIRADQETNVGDILARTPGVNFVRNGGPGEPTTIYIRGAEADQTMVLIDGVKVNDPTNASDGYDLTNLIAGDISRIEVLRGPQSTLYGSEAIGGVVNIITADATKPLQGDIQAEGGSYGTAYVKGSIAGKQDRYDWRLGAYYNSTTGISAFDRAFGGKEADGFQTTGLSGRLHYDLTGNLQLDQRAYYTWSRVDFDGFNSSPPFRFMDDSEYGHTEQLVDYTGLNLSSFNGRLKSRLAYQFDAIDHDNQNPDQPGTTTTFVALGRTHTVEYEGAYAIAPGYQLVFGAQSEWSTMSVQSPEFDPAPTLGKDNIASGYGQITGEVVRGLTLSGGLRFDSHSVYGGHLTGQASAAWRLFDGNTILRASFGQGFKAPSLYQLYSQYGNLALKPEQANGWDVGIEQHFLHGRLVVQATYFGRDTQNLIEFVSCFDDQGNESTAGLCATHLLVGGYYDNVDKAEAQGVELQADWQATDRLSFSGNYTYDQTVDRSPGSPTYGLQLPQRPESTANLIASYVWPIKLKTDLAVRYAGESFNDAAHTIPLKSYVLLDLRASYPLRENLELYGRIENLANARYETAYQYGTLGRAAYVGVHFNF